MCQTVCQSDLMGTRALIQARARYVRVQVGNGGGRGLGGGARCGWKERERHEC